MNDEPILAALARLEAGQTQLEARQVRLEAGQTQLQAELVRTRGDLMARIDRMQDTLTGMRDDMVVSFGSVEQVRRINDNTREEVRGLHELIAGMQRQIQRLQTDVRQLKGEQ